MALYGIDKCSKGTPRRERTNHDIDKVTTIITHADINPLSIRDSEGKFKVKSVMQCTEHNQKKLSICHHYLGYLKDLEPYT